MDAVVSGPDPRPEGADAPLVVRYGKTWPRGRRLDGSKFFAVLSWGCAGTTWLAKALNSHPEIFCVHGVNFALRVGSEPRLQFEGVEYAAFVERLARYYPVVGDVHGLNPSDMVPLRKKLGAAFACAVLVREPIERLKSRLSFRGLPTRRPNLDLVDELMERLELPLADLDEEGRFFVHSANMLNTILREQEHGPVYRMEDVTTSPKVFAELLVHLTGGVIEPDPVWLDWTLRVPAVRVAPTEKPDLTDEQWELLARVVQPEAWAAYEAVGYERPTFVAAP